MDYIKRVGETMNSYHGVLGSKRSRLGPQEIRRLNDVYLTFCVIAFSLDPLFCYILVLNVQKKCLRLDTTLGTPVVVLRFLVDLFYIIHMVFQFRAAIVSLRSQASGRVEEMRAIARRYLFFYFPADVLVILPLPQVLIFAIVPKLNASRVLGATKSLNFTVVFQYVLRLLRICSLLKKVTSNSGILAGTAWANLFLYMLASHVVGAFWYLFSIERNVSCWSEACQNHTGVHCSLFCDDTFGARSFPNNSCSTKIPSSTPFNFGIYADALESGVVNDSADFVQKISYCFWWGLQNLSSLGQGLKTSTYVWEVYYAVFVSLSGLVLLSSLIGNMQTYLQLKTARLADMRSKEQEREYWMAFYALPPHLKKRIREYPRDQWQENTGVSMENFFLSLPREIRSDTKRHICLPLLRRVPMFEKMDEQLLDAMCDRLKPVLYTEESYIVREGNPVDEMLFIKGGRLLTMTTNGGRTGFLNYQYLKAGDFCGEELLIWALDPHASSNLPISTRTVKALSEVEAFALKADDLKFVASQFRRLHSKQLQHTFRFYSHQWRNWAAAFIQAAWRRHMKKKLEESLREEENRLQDALANAGVSSPSLGATIYASRFAANTLRSTWKARVPERLTAMLLQKPAEPDFNAKEQ
ncbi:unnamed protein product [Malus baccata var. baccata]